MIALCTRCKFADTVGYFVFNDQVLCVKCYKWELWREQRLQEAITGIPYSTLEPK